MLPGIMNQLGAENVWSLKNLANTLKNAAEGAKSGATGEAAIEEEDEDDVPQLVENFEEASKSEPVVASEDVKIEEIK
jgi:nascent polypeptide-associated complex subunit beta